MITSMTGIFESDRFVCKPQLCQFALSIMKHLFSNYCVGDMGLDDGKIGKYDIVFGFKKLGL